MNSNATVPLPAFARLCRRAAAALALIGSVALTTSAVAGPKKKGPPVQVQQPTPRVELTGSVQWTGVSGYTGYESTVLGPSGKNRAAYAVKWWEDSDEPCKWQVWSKRLDGTVDIKRFTDEFCHGSEGDMKAVSRPDPSEFITGVEVCVTDKKKTSKDKLKGVRLYGRMLDAETGELGPEHGPEEARHANCEEWSQKVSCPSGQIASKVRVHYSLDHDRGTFSDPHGYARGISLGCRAVQVVEPPSL